MAVLTQQPKNINPLADVQFKFDVAALPNTSFFIQSVNLPGISLEGANIGVPQLQNFSRHTGVITYEPLSVTFMIDEYLKNWQEIFEWMVGEESKYTTAVLSIVSSSMNPTLEIHFKDIFPTNLGSLDFTTQDTEIVAVTAICTFDVTDFTIETVT